MHARSFRGHVKGHEYILVIFGVLYKVANNKASFFREFNTTF